MTYKINVALNGHHYFEAECRGADEEKALTIYDSLREKFPVSEGYCHRLVYWQTTGKEIATSAAFKRGE